MIRGNYDDGVGKRAGSCGCYYPTDEDKRVGAESYARTDAALDGAEHEYLAALRDDIRFGAEEARVLLCHGSPRRINEYLMPDRPDDNLAKLADIGEADVVCFGHIHIPYHRVVTAERRPRRALRERRIGGQAQGRRSARVLGRARLRHEGRGQQGV